MNKDKYNTMKNILNSISEFGSKVDELVEKYKHVKIFVEDEKELYSKKVRVLCILSTISISILFFIFTTFKFSLFVFLGLFLLYFYVNKLTDGFVCIHNFINIAQVKCSDIERKNCSVYVPDSICHGCRYFSQRTSSTKCTIHISFCEKCGKIHNPIPYLKEKLTKFEKQYNYVNEEIKNDLEDLKNDLEEIKSESGGGGLLI